MWTTGLANSGVEETMIRTTTVVDLSVLLWLVCSLAARAADTRSLDNQLIDAAGKGDAAAVRQILAQGVDPSAKDHALIVAAREGHAEAAKLLLEEGANVNAYENDNAWENDSALQWASSGGYVEVVKLLLDKGADIAVKDRRGETALHLAAEQGYPEVVRLLLVRGAKIEDKRTTVAKRHCTWRLARARPQSSKCSSIKGPTSGS